MSRSKKFNTKYSPEFKVSVIIDMREHGLSYHETVRKYWGVSTRREIDSKAKPSDCFIAGTKILTEHGKKNIEDIKVGDKVWSWNETTKKQELKPVVQLFRNNKRDMVYLTVGGEKITTTTEHPFYVKVKGWLRAENLLDTDILVCYSIRTSNVKSDMGNLPLWLTDFFVPRDVRNSRRSHILDFDVLRLGKRVIDENPNIGSFEFGVVTISEIGKERGNDLELREVKKGTDEANQKNDLFNSWLKMCRHSATVDNFPFIKVFTDEQRPESWGADAKDLCDVIQIVSSGEALITLPFYKIQDMLCEWLFNRFMATYTDFRYRRGDNTLFIYLYKKLAAWVWNRNVRNYNHYGYCVLSVETERGTMDGKSDKKKYYIMNAKIYGKRFSTDCFSDYFNDLASRSNVGLDDYLEYQTEKASVAELQSQNSYFINSLYGR